MNRKSHKATGGSGFAQCVLQVLFLFFGLLANGCSGPTEEKPPAKHGLAFNMPTALKSAGLPEGADLDAYAEIKQLNSRIRLAIRNGRADGEIRNFPAGQYTVSVVFDAVNTGFGRVTLAEATFQLNATAGRNQLSVQESDFIYPDSDDDRYANLVELNYSTDPFNANSSPRTALVFLTTAFGTGDLSSWRDAGGKSGLAAADHVCQARAVASGLPGNFVAWLSDDKDDAYCRLHGLSGKVADRCGQASLPEYAGPWVRADGLPSLPTLKTYVDDAVVYFPPAQFNEFGLDEFFAAAAAGNPGNDYWTGSTSQGEAASFHCNNWGSAAPGDMGASGSSDDASALWAHRYDEPCSEKRMLLCFESPGLAPLPKFREQGKVVFLTSVTGNGDLSSWPDAEGKSGLAAGDAICQKRAREGGRSNPERFKAWLSTDTENAIDRLTSNGPWVRPDGALIARDKSTLRNLGPATGIALDEYGGYMKHPTINTGPDSWTGSDSWGEKLQFNCHNWTESGDSERGVVGIGWANGSNWAFFHTFLEPIDDAQKDQYMRLFSRPCSTKLKLFCFEDE